MKIIDYDKIDEWEALITDILFPTGLGEIRSELRNENPEYIEDASDLVIEILGKDEILKKLREPHGSGLYYCIKELLQFPLDWGFSNSLLHLFYAAT